ncbi:ESX secretion-associated protein EspG [Nocardia cyriacigeorgica]|uniref:ESX secretion-associated protein EspG n=1 Tax=Nocardia cyriacigeorgica TaxID=135487 RepID=UPI002458D270|nr:ESX secretion-associated protein EspG [Nocardia cyriacigeorgica]
MAGVIATISVVAGCSSSVDGQGGPSDETTTVADSELASDVPKGYDPCTDMAVMSDWTWDPDDFAALWLNEANDRFPRPLHYLSRFRYLEDFQAHKSRVLERYSREEFEEIELALRTLTNSALRIEIRGSTTNTNKARVREYRILGARDAFYSVIAAQAVHDGSHGPIRVRIVQPEKLPVLLSNWLPSCEPGRHHSATFHMQDLRDDSGGLFESDAYNSPQEQYRRLVGRKLDGGGNAGLLVGDILARPNPWNTLRWHDIRNDGRYLERRAADHVTVQPASPQEITNIFSTWFDRAITRLREEGEVSW